MVGYRMLGPNTLIKKKQPCIRRKMRRPTLTNLMPVINHNNAQRHRIIKEQQQVVKRQEAGTEILPGRLYLTSIFEAEDQNYLSQNQISAILTINNEPLKPGTPGSIINKYLCLGDNCTTNISDYRIPKKRYKTTISTFSSSNLNFASILMKSSSSLRV